MKFAAFFMCALFQTNLMQLYIKINHFNEIIDVLHTFKGPKISLPK